MKQFYKVLLFTLCFNISTSFLQAMEEQVASDYSSWSDEDLMGRLDVLLGDKNKQSNPGEMEDLLEEKEARKELLKLSKQELSTKINNLSKFSELGAKKDINRINRILDSESPFAQQERKTGQTKKELPIDKRPQQPLVEKLSTIKRNTGPERRKPSAGTRGTTKVVENPTIRDRLFGSIKEASEFTEGEPNLSPELLKEQALSLRKTPNPISSPVAVSTGSKAALKKTSLANKGDSGSSKTSHLQLQAKLKAMKEKAALKTASKKVKPIPQGESVSAEPAFSEKETDQTVIAEPSSVKLPATTVQGTEKTSGKKEKRKSTGFLEGFKTLLGLGTESDEVKAESVEEKSTEEEGEKEPVLQPTPKVEPDSAIEPKSPIVKAGEKASISKLTPDLEDETRLEIDRKRLEETLARQKGEIVAEKTKKLSGKLKKLHKSLNQLSMVLSHGG